MPSPSTTIYPTETLYPGDVGLPLDLAAIGKIYLLDRPVTRVTVTEGAVTTANVLVRVTLMTSLEGWLAFAASRDVPVTTVKIQEEPVTTVRTREVAI